MNLESLKRKIAYLSTSAQHAIVSSVLEVLPGTTFVSKRKAEERLELCEDCDSLEETTRKCTECGCFVDEKTRVERFPMMEPVHCPLNKW